MKFFSITVHFLVYLAISTSHTKAVGIYNALLPSNVLIQYSGHRDLNRLVLIDLTLSGESTKMVAIDEADLPGAPEPQETKTGETPEGTPNRTDKRSLRHGKEFISFTEIREATILYGPEDVECYFFYITLDKMVMPEQSSVRYPKPLRPFRRFLIDRENQYFVAIECEGSAP